MESLFVLVKNIQIHHLGGRQFECLVISKTSVTQALLNQALPLRWLNMERRELCALVLMGRKELTYGLGHNLAVNLQSGNYTLRIQGRIGVLQLSRVQREPCRNSTAWKHTTRMAAPTWWLLTRFTALYSYSIPFIAKAANINIKIGC